jgi:hypothetical protein
MSPITHFLIGWSVGCMARLKKRDRAIVALAAVAPDLDGLGAIAEVATRNSEEPLLWFSEYHHVLGHNLGMALAVMVVAFLAAERKRLTTSTPSRRPIGETSCAGSSSPNAPRLAPKRPKRSRRRRPAIKRPGTCDRGCNVQAVPGRAQ